MDTINCNSSYVLIIITALRKVSDWVSARPPVPQVNILIFSIYVKGRKLRLYSFFFNTSGLILFQFP